MRPMEKLISIYLKSVGGNSVLLLNIPPHKDGYITKYDIKRLEEIGSFIKNSFKDNFTLAAKLNVSSTDRSNSIENVKFEDESYWKAEDWTESCEIEIELEQEKCIKYIMLMEQIKLSQRIEEFELLAKIDSEYKKIYSGTTVGYKKICDLETPITARNLKLRILASRKCPTLKYLGIY